MTEQEREYMERYIYEAVKRVQKKQKKELESNNAEWNRILMQGLDTEDET